MKFVKLVFYQNAGEQYGGILIDEPCIVKYVRIDDIESFRIGDETDHADYSVVFMKDGQKYYIPDNYVPHLIKIFDAMAPDSVYRTRTE